MHINVIRIYSDLHASNKRFLQEGENFLEEINNELINDDLLLVPNDKDASLSVIFVESGGAEEKFVKLLPSLKEPFILLSHGKNNSLPAALEIKTFLFQQKKTCLLLTGEERQIAGAIRQTSEVINAYNKLQNNNLGVIGEPSDWLIASKVSAEDVSNKFHINLVKIGMEEFFKEINKKKMENVPHFEQLHKRFKDQETLDMALYIYSALKRLVNKYHLQGLTVRCFDLLGKYKNTSCLALALLNEEGITAACEGDVPSLLTMHFLNALTDLPSFQANPSQVNFDTGTILFAHCTLPLNMCSKYSLTTHFESGLGIGIKGDLPIEKVTIAKISPDLSANHSIAFYGTVKENCSLPGYCRTQLLVEPDEDSIFSLFKDNVGNHMIITYADCLGGFYSLLSMFEK